MPSLEPTRVPVYRLIGAIGEREKTFELAVGHHQVGSAREAEIRLPVKGVSRRHARLTVTRSALVVEDLESTNHTYIDGELVERGSVRAGAELSFGPVKLQVDAVAPDEASLAFTLDLPSEATQQPGLFEADETTLVVAGENDPTQIYAGLSFPKGYRPGLSPPMARLYKQMQRLRRGNLPVLISGETGAGKELVARILHDSSDRRDEPFVAVNCAAIPSDLLESEMFGIDKGVATGVEAREGKFRAAKGGTLFLDEIGEMAPALQAKLLRVLQEHEIHPLGSSQSIPIDVRVIAATNVDLDAHMQDGTLRTDLYYRLAGLVLDVPPLRQCPDDIPFLVQQFLQRFAEETGVRIRGMTVAALAALQAYHWPGNIRQLEHEIRGVAYLSADGEVVGVRRLTERVLRPRGPKAKDPYARLVDELDSLEVAANVGQLEERLIREALQRAHGVKLEAARLLGLSRTGLDNKIKRHGIEVQAPGKDPGTQTEET